MGGVFVNRTSFSSSYQAPQTWIKPGDFEIGESAFSRRSVLWGFGFFARESRGNRTTGVWINPPRLGHRAIAREHRRMKADRDHAARTEAQP